MKDDASRRLPAERSSAAAGAPKSAPTPPATPPTPPAPSPETFSLLTEADLYLFHEGTHYRLWEKLGSHLVTVGGVPGVYFAVWAPAAKSVHVIGGWNAWDPTAHPLRPRAGIWEGFIPGVARGAHYRYRIVSMIRGYTVEKADPFAFTHAQPPDNSSIVWDLDYAWRDAAWIEARDGRDRASEPLSIYEVHAGSWRRVPQEENRSLRYRELAPGLAHYAKETGFTHVQLMPVMEHPFIGSWGYQITGYFAPTSRQGRPQDCMAMIDTLHQAGVGVILDWVPSHFPDDPHALGFFDGTYLFEHADPRKGFHPDWKSLIFNYGRPEVRSFLISNALFWLEQYHADGLRVDAVASMLYLDYSRKEGEWTPNEFGGRENLSAIRFIQQLNQAIAERHPHVRNIAEESTSWPMVTRPVHLGGLGFDHKWDMGWMHDTLRYMARRPIHRRFHHNELTFRTMYAQSEKFVLALSHDETVHGKYSLLEKMPGDDSEKFANLRLLFAYQIAQPGRKMLFMGCEFGQRREWNHDSQLDWELLQQPAHAGVRRWLADLNRLYTTEPAMHVRDESHAGFEWVDCNDPEQNALTLLRLGREADPTILIALNFSGVTRFNYEVGVPSGGWWTELLNSNAVEYGGSGLGNEGGREAREISVHGRPFSLSIHLPALTAVFFSSGGAAPPPPPTESPSQTNLGAESR